ncbi:hypothetical protein AB2S32_14610 [Elizabethkingia anophelis]|uniref:hypothetical protein n=1 Tax=Elizabethkingia anophelis TaxID=1117645 RepID=UPI0034624EAB|nr:hypothetical protein [Elizabethkingia anophelis]
MKKTLSILLVAALTVMSCQSTKKVSDKEMTKETGMNMKVPFTLAKNYFIKNTIEDKPTFVEKITNEEGFEKFFGAAATMNNMPTKIDFSKQYVIAVINPSTDMLTSLNMPTLSKSGDIITLAYEEKVEGKQSYSMRPCLILVVDNQYQGEIKTVKK